MKKIISSSFLTLILLLIIVRAEGPHSAISIGNRVTITHWHSDINATPDTILPITVNMKDSNDEAVDAEFRFLMDGVEQETFVTESNGSFSGHIPPGTYDIELTLPGSKLILYEVIVDSFDDPIKFDHPSSDVSIPGMGVGEVYVFEADLSYSDVYLELKYDSSEIPDENEITVYKCGNWNFDERTCSGDWETVDPEIDTDGDLIKINTTSLSAYLVGYEKELVLNVNTDKDEYSLNDIIKVTGTVEDEDGKSIPDAEITVMILNTKISDSGQTDNEGAFSFELTGPNKGGDYEIFVEADNSLFSSVDSSKKIKVVGSSQLSMLVPETIEIKQGESSTMSVSIINTGQTDFSDLKLSLSDIPENYYTLPEIGELKAGEEKKFTIDFTIPEDAGEATHTGKLKITYDDTYSEEQFVLIVLGVEENENIPTGDTVGSASPSSDIPTAKTILPNMRIDALTITVFTVFIFFFVVLVKKRKPTTGTERDDVKNLLLDIKREVENPSAQVETDKIESIKERMEEFRKTLKKRKLNDS